MKKINKLDIMTIFLGIIFLIFTLLLCYVDKKMLCMYGENGKLCSEIGLSKLNDVFLVNKLNDSLDKISDLFMYMALVLFIAISIFYFVRIVKYKSITKAGTKYLMYILVMALLVAFWLFFEKVVIVNYRPFTYESSYPSTHVLICCYLLPSSFYLLFDDVKSKKIKIVGYSIIGVIIILVGALRILSGMHWFTDVIGGLILGAFLLLLFFGLVDDKEKE